MGCSSSKENGLSNVDDSVHVMIKHDKKVAAKKGIAPHGYVPRAPHPLLDASANEAGGTAATTTSTTGETKEATSTDDN